MLAVGPQLVGIQPNVGELLAEGQVRSTAPRELSLLFNSVADIAESSLPTNVSSLLAYDSIQVTRSGLDGEFEHASLFTDFNTAGAVQVEFEAVAAGQVGNVISIFVNKNMLGDDPAPAISVQGSRINLTLNTRAGFQTRASDLIAAVNAHTEASRLVNARLRAGDTATNITAPAITYSPLSMTPANTASAIASFNAGNTLAIEFRAIEPGTDGNGVTVQVTRSNLGQNGAPQITATGKTVSVVLNSNTLTPTTASQLINAVNAHPTASMLVRATLRSGARDTLIGNRTVNYSPIVLLGADDERVELGYLGLGDTPREVLLRFQDHLPDDKYMIEILGSGPTPLRNEAGEAFNDGISFQMSFELDLGAQVISVVPQPVVRNASGQLTQLRNVIEVYFNDDVLNPTSAENPLFYQLIHTQESVSNADDVVVYPESVAYDAARDMAVLTFGAPLEQLVAPGTYRLRIGTDEAKPGAPVDVNLSPVEDPGSSFDTAKDLSSYDLSSNALQLTSRILSFSFPLDYPGGNDEPGHRDIPWLETHLNAGGDTSPRITEYYYNFTDEYGVDPNGQVLHNAITEAQKQRAREVFDFYARYLGVSFTETANRGLTIVTGDLRALNPSIPVGVGGAAGLATRLPGGGGMAIMDLQDFDTPGNDVFGGSWFQTAMHEIGHLLGLGHTYDLPDYTIMGNEPAWTIGQTVEAVFPGDYDVMHGQYLHRPDSNDIDLYRFELADAGVFSAETFATRQEQPSLLDTVLTLYRAEVDATGRVVTRELVARNDDYYNKDSFLELYLQPGTYFVGVSAGGNDSYDPAVENSGSGGLSQGLYDLRLNFRADVDNSIVDTTGVALDGDGNGISGGVYNFWFRTAAPMGQAATGEPRTLFVDKAAPNGGDGSLARPFNRLPAALTAARPDDVVRLVGNAGADGDITTLADNLAYEIGFSRVGGAVLQDGSTLEVPQGVTMMIDANAVLKLRRARIGVGSSAQGMDRSAGSLQVLGVPRMFDGAGNVLEDITGQPIAGSVYFTSLHDTTMGKGANPDTAPPAAQPGDWGGIVFRNDLDIADSNRLQYEQEGIFLNYVNNADMRFGGGSVFINGVAQSIAPVFMIDARPTLSFNTITTSSGAAMSANPDSFQEDNFHAPQYQGLPFTSDYSRVGPEIHHNTLTGNSLNGLFIRVSTAAGESIERLTKSARWDDTDIVHIVSENLIIDGQAGGPLLEDVAPPVNIVKADAVAGGTLAPGDYSYKLVYVDRDGNEGPASDPIGPVAISAATGAVMLRNLPRIGQDEPFVARRIYRALGTGTYERVVQINAEDTTYLDKGASTGIPLQEFTDSIRARLSASLVVDPGTVVKLNRARIEASFGAQLIAEGRDGQPVVFTSLRDSRYGFGGTFDTASQQNLAPAARGDWSGLYLGHLSKASLDFTVLAYAGGTSRIEGNFAGFNPIEIHQADARIANTRFEHNANGQGGQAPADRYGRGTHDASTVFIRGAQPIIVGNTFVDNSGSVISINVNSLNHLLQIDTGRSTGPIGIVSEVIDNHGPLVRLNRLADNEINGLNVRGGTLTTQSIWDDTDIVHVLRSEVVVPDYHTYGGLRLQSNPQESLVVKLAGGEAGFTASGRELDITDRIGGSVQIVGQPRSPVILTSLNDNSVGAGYTPEGMPQNQTVGATPAPAPLPTSSGVIKPTNTVLGARYETDVIVVKFQEGLKIRLFNGVLTDRNAITTGVNVLADQAVQAVLSSVAGGRWERFDTVSEETLDQMVRTAEENLGRDLADLNLYYYLHLPQGANAATVINAFNSLNIVELAQGLPKPLTQPSTTVLDATSSTIATGYASPNAYPAPLSENYVPNQGYLSAGPTGIGALGAWTLDVTGAGVRVVDIEYTFNANHQDLPNVTILGPTPEDPGYGDDHGTAVLGQLAALDNGWGVTGIAPDASYYFAGAFTNGEYRLAEAITAATAAIRPGDVILLEQQIAGPNYDPDSGSQFGLVPVEWYKPYYDRIVTAVGNGVIVVEAAGNGSQNLDDAAYTTGNSGHYPFLPQNNSGAIIVGAGSAPSQYGGSDIARSRLDFSNYGSRVDLQGWGNAVWTTGYGDAYSAEGVDLYYTSSFGGTSSASPIVTGAVTLLQSAYKSTSGGVLSPAAMLQALRSTGSPQQSGTNPASQNIGPLPNVGAALGSALGNPAQPGDWRSVKLEEFSHDRNVDVITEREPRDSTTGPGNNSTPDAAQIIGSLAPHEKAGDDTRRLGFEIHGVISETSDVDVYSFQASAGTEVWFDIDRTDRSLDAVVELIDAHGNIIAQSDNSYAEELGDLSLYSDASRIDPRWVNPLRKSATELYPESALGEPKDLWSTNLGDAGMRVILPGSQNTTNTYYVRVRSSNIKAGEAREALQDPARIRQGLTTGVYQLQLRLRETDEVPGSTIQFADIRYAQNGIEIYGQPTHSPLSGEAAEVAVTNDTSDLAQLLGNLMNSERGTLSVAGGLSSATDVDFYRFDITVDSIQMIGGVTNTVQHLATIFDIDYADGLSRANTRLSVFDANGNLVLIAGDSNIADDQPAPLNNLDMDDLSRGSAGVLDPYIGTQELPVGTYYVAVSSDGQLPIEMEQFYNIDAANPLLRLEPINSVERIVEDHINNNYVTTAADPQIPVLFNNDNAVPYHLGDVVMFVSYEIDGATNARLATIDPFTGTIETTVGTLNRNIGDIAMRSDGTLRSFSLNNDFADRSDDVAGNYLLIDTGNASVSNTGDDGIETYQLNVDGDEERHSDDGVGYEFNAITFGDPDNFETVHYLFAVGDRLQGRGVRYNENVLYQFNADTGAAITNLDENPDFNRQSPNRWQGAGTQIRERGYLDTADLATLQLVEATLVNAATGVTTPRITDGLTFEVDHDGFAGTPPLIFEFNAGPEIQLTPDPANGAYVLDGDTFELDGEFFEFDTGSVVVVLAATGVDITDGRLLTITDDQDVTTIFEFDKDGTLTDDTNTPITITDAMVTDELISQIMEAINGVADYTVTAELLTGTNRITLRGESTVTGATSGDANVEIQGTPGGGGDYVIPIEETSELDEYGNALVTTLDAHPSITAGWDGDRVNFSGALLGVFTDIVARGVFVDVGSDGTALLGIEVPFLAQDTAEELAVKVAAVVDAELTPPRTATATADRVELTGRATFEDADNPLQLVGSAPGGTITGIAFIGTAMYAVTDRGGLYQVTGYTSTGGARANYIASSATDLLGIRFQSLSAGPVETEDGRYAQMLFGLDSNGTLYAFNTSGQLQPVFVDGQTSVTTGLVGLDNMRGVHGVAFSTLEENPWGIVNGQNVRATDPGHGLELVFDESRYSPSFRRDGGASLHFGRNQTSDYNWPGGAHGTLESNAFSLAGYTAADKPMLYFNYFAETEQESSDPGTQTPMMDSLRVYVSNDTGGWDLLATNNSYTPDELARPLSSAAETPVQEVFDNGNGWRQVRVELSNYAGRDNVQIRIDFATSGDMNTGDPTTVGSELRMVPGSELSDGQRLTIDFRQFEIEMGYTLVIPSGAAVNEGDTIRVLDSDDGDWTFEFDSNDSVADSEYVPIRYRPDMTPDELATAVADAIVSKYNEPEFRIVTVGNRINLPDAASTTVSPGGVRLAGSPNTGGIPIRVDASMTAIQVAQVVQQALADEFATGVTEAFKLYDNVVRVIGHTVDVQGPFGLTDSLPGNSSGNFFSNLRGQDNAYEGIYLDDFIIGFAERGEVVTNASGQTTFYANPALLPNQALSGPYQLEIRQAEKYGTSRQGPARLVLNRSFDTNARLTGSQSLIAPAANEITDGQTFVIGDGVNSLTFEYDDVTVNNGVAPGNVRVPYNPMLVVSGTGGDRRPQTAAEVAAAIRNAINSPSVQAVLKVTAALGDGAVTSATPSTNSIVNLFGNANFEITDPVFGVTSTTTDGNQLRNAILDQVLNPVGNAVFKGGTRSAGFFTAGADLLGIGSGIVLTTGDARYVKGPNTSENSSATASGTGDADLDALLADSFPDDAFTTVDATTLEFSFNLARDRDLFFEFVFSTEEYPESLGGEFNDIFAAFLDGENFVFVPGTSQPVTVNTVSYVGGDPSQYAELFGHDGFTFVMTVGVNNVPAGTHTLKFAIADVGADGSDSAVFIRALNQTGPDPGVLINPVTYTDKGDSNLRREQGQVIIHSNTISTSLGYGILIAPGGRSTEGKPHAGPVRVTRELNLNNLVPGVVVANNLLTYNNLGGISFSGDQNLGSVAAAPVPFGRIINNTIYGGNVGILVQHNASPTLLNNIVAENSIGLSIDASSSSTIVGGTLYAGPGVRSSNGNLGDSPIEVLRSDDVFMNRHTGNFYPKPASPAIDSSIDSLLDRPAMTTIRQPLGIASSPILAPNFDLFGQRRSDDPDVLPPSGLGQNVFKDRGAIDRSDLAGPSAILVNPQDNDVLGNDRDREESIVELKNASLTLFHFSIQLLDGVPPSNDAYGSGADPSTVTAETVFVTKNGVPLREGTDYQFTYDATSAVVRLTPLAGIWEPDQIYEVRLQNVDTLVFSTRSGDLVTDGATFTINNELGQSTTFEYESGYSLLAPRGSVVADGSRFTVTRDTITTTFEFDRNGFHTSGNVVVPYRITDTPDMVAAAIATAMRNAAIGLDPQAYSGGIVHVGGDTQTLINVTGTVLALAGEPGVEDGNIPVPYIPHVSFTAEDMAEAITEVINAGPLAGVTAETRWDQVVLTGAASATGVAAWDVGAIRDLAGNALQANRFTNETAFTIMMPQLPYDFGDAPASYGTLLANNGARHLATDLSGGLLLGATVTAENDGQPVDGDEDNGVDLTFAVFNQHLQTPVIVAVTQSGYLDAWIDFNQDGDWNDAGEQVFVSYELAAGENVLMIETPASAAIGNTFARFRVSSQGGLQPYGLAMDGEVEDYQIRIEDGVPPVAADDDGFETEKSQSLTITPEELLANDTDEDLLPEELSIWRFDAVSARGAAITLDADGNLVYDPSVSAELQALDPNISVVDTFSYQAFDGVLPSNEAVVSILITGLNRPPAVTDDAYVTDEDRLLEIPAPGVLANDLDPDVGDTIFVHRWQGISNYGAVVAMNADGSFTYDPRDAVQLQSLALNDSVDDTFTYTVEDSWGAMSVGTVTVTVEGLNDPPTAMPDLYNTDEDNVRIIPAPGVLSNDSDIDGDDITVQNADATSAWGAVVSVNPDGSLSYDPTGSDALQNLAVNEFVQDTFSYTIVDQHGATATATVTLTVAGVNDLPTAVDDDYSVFENEVLTIASAGVLTNDSDRDGDTLQVDVAASDAVSARGIPLTLRVDGSFVYDPTGAGLSLAPGDIALDSFTYVVKDPYGGTASATVTIEVSGVNSPPVATDKTFDTDEDTPLSLPAPGVLAGDHDPDGQAISLHSYDAVSAWGASVVVNADGSFTYNPTGSDALQALSDGDVITDSFTYTIVDSDANPRSATATISIEVTGVNDPPVAVDDSALVKRNTATVIPVLENDFDIDGTLVASSVRIVSQPAHGTVTVLANGTVRYQSTGSFSGLDVFTYTVRDNSGAISNEATVSLQVNAAPVAVDDQATTTRDLSKTINVLANDFDVDGSLAPNTVTVVSQPKRGSVSVAASGAIVYTPNIGFTGNDSFTYTVADNLGLVSNEAVVSISITLSAFPWQNPRNPLDVNNDGFVSPIDALLVISDINRNGARPLPNPPVPPFTPPPYLDVSGDNTISPIDALIVVSFLNNPSGSGEGEWDAEGEGGLASAASTTAVSPSVSRVILTAPTTELPETTVRETVALDSSPVQEPDDYAVRIGSDAADRAAALASFLATESSSLDDILDQLAEDDDSLQEGELAEDEALLDLLSGK